jgi:N-acetylglucosaminyl-diphospho-decaprenol L-rhamnosyltransferase
VDVSVVIVTYNSRPYLGECLETLRAQTKGVEYEVIIVDNASPDRTAAWVRAEHPWVRLIARERNAGLSRAVNDGVAASCGTHVMVVNPDVRFEMDVLSPLATYLRDHPDVGVVGPRLLNDDGSLQLSCRAFPGYSTALFSRYSLLTRLLPDNPFSRRYLMADFDHASERDVDWLSGAALMFPRAAFDAVGGWDPEFFMYSEDVDFCRRVRDAGYRVVYNPVVSLVHHIGGSTRTVPARMVVERHRSMWRYYRKHLRGGPARDAVTGAGIAARCGVMLGITAGERVARTIAAGRS